jgi:hypothetical protein
MSLIPPHKTRSCRANRLRSRRSEALVPPDPIEPMSPELRDWHLQRQKRLEELGLWEQANILNARLSGAFISEADFAKGRIAPMRTAFLRRMQRTMRLIGSTSRKRGKAGL